MEIIYKTADVLIGLIGLIFVAGLINPKWVIPKTITPNRWKVAVYLLIAIALSSLKNATEPDDIKQAREKSKIAAAAESEKAKQPIATQPSSNMASKLASLIGKHPGTIPESTELKTTFATLLGGAKKNFIDRLEVADVTEHEGNWVIGSGMASHLGGTDEAAFAIDINSGKAFATMLVDGKSIHYFGVSNLAELPPPLLEWYKEHGGQFSNTQQQTLSLQGITNNDQKLYADSSLPPKSESLKGNLLEVATYLDRSTKEHFRKFKDEGGLDANSIWHGLKVSNVDARYAADGSLNMVALKIYPEHTEYNFVGMASKKVASPKRVREILSEVCKIPFLNWKVHDSGFEGQNDQGWNCIYHDIDKVIILTTKSF